MSVKEILIAVGLVLFVLSFAFFKTTLGLRILLAFRKIYAPVVGFFMMKKIIRNHTKEEIATAKQKYLDFVTNVVDPMSYKKEISAYPWRADIGRGLFDWYPKKKDLWQFFLDKDHSRDCDDFSTLAYHTLKDKGYNIKEYCIFIDKRIVKSHMICQLDNYQFDNNSVYDIKQNPYAKHPTLLYRG